jgi:hypothetical protein
MGAKYGICAMVLLLSSAGAAIGQQSSIKELLPGPGPLSRLWRKIQMARKRSRSALALTRIMRDGEELRDGCGKKRAIHVANRCSSELQCASALRHSRHEPRYAASLRPSICRAQETHN